ncbi:MAG: response regulator transcription factor [Steroidobacteraceae bacterium]
MSDPRPHVLIVDDDAELRSMLGEYLANEQIEVDTAPDGATALRMLERQRPDLLLLDVTMPGMNGFELLRRVRDRWPVPVLMLTARDDVVDRVLGLELGADDYLTKPFNGRELLARIHAVLRRAQGAMAGTAAETIGLGRLALDTGMHQARVDGTAVPLTDAEYRVLEVLVRNAGRVVSRAELTQKALGRRHLGLDRSVDTHVSNLRRKLGTAVEQSTPIMGVRGAGYMIGQPASDEPGH